MDSIGRDTCASIQVVCVCVHLMATNVNVSLNEMANPLCQVLYNLAHSMTQWSVCIGLQQGGIFVVIGDMLQLLFCA